MKQFYIISVKHTLRQHAYITAWRPDDCGYAYPLSWAGRYDEAIVRAHLDYYNDGHSTIAVPCSIVDALAVPPSPGMIDNDAGPVVENTRDNWHTLILNTIEPPPHAVRPEHQGARRRKEAA